MTQEKLAEINTLVREINILEELCRFMSSEIEKYDSEPTTKMTSFDLYYNAKHKMNLNEEEVKLIYDIFNARLERYTRELRQIIWLEDFIDKVYKKNYKRTIWKSNVK